MRLEEKIATRLITSKKTLATAESCTGGLLAHTLTNIPGSSAFFWLGIIAYDNAAKNKLLKIPLRIIEQNGAVSQQVAKAMALGVRRLLKTDYGIGITGIAGPNGGSTSKPVGLVYIALSSNTQTTIKEFRFKGSRLSIKRQSAAAALNLLYAALKIPA